MDRATNRMKKISKLTLVPVLIASLSTPLFALAQTGINQGPLTSYSRDIINLINGVLVPTLMAVAFIVFLYGVYKYFILGADDEKSRTEGRQFALWGIIGFVVILSVWGLVAIVRNTLNLTGDNTPTPPTFKI
jgi:hypothetical protein